MWWRFLTFCVLVCFVLFVVLSCIHGRPVIHLLFRRCCEDDIENDQVILEDFDNNYLRERLVGAGFVVEDNDSFVLDLEVENMIKAMRQKINVHNPRSRSESDKAHQWSNESSNETSAEIETNMKAKKLLHEMLELASDNVTFTDLLLDSQETIDEGKMTSANENISELSSEENNSIEVTTENNHDVRTKLELPLRITDVFKKQVDTDHSVLGISDKNITKNPDVLQSTSVYVEAVEMKFGPELLESTLDPLCNSTLEAVAAATHPVVKGGHDVKKKKIAGKPSTANIPDAVQ